MGTSKGEIPGRNIHFRVDANVPPMINMIPLHFASLTHRTNAQQPVL